jgi:acyl-CoA thioester hydrolase
VLLTAEVKVAALRASTFKPVGLPDTLYEEFRRLENPGQPL